MHSDTVHTLNRLNRSFYQKIAANFSSSRQHAWPGWEHAWEQLSPHLPPKQLIRVLDLGCGNGRFAKFLAKKTVKFSYLGIDQDPSLLRIADRDLGSLGLDGGYRVRSLDIVSSLLAENQLSEVDGTFDVILVLGLIHHVPSYHLRKSLMVLLKKHLNPGGVIVLACWQFDKNEKLFNKRVTAESVEISQHELEPNDFFLTWDNDDSAVRYCHLVDTAEQDKLIRESGLTCISRFAADGPPHAGNQYLLLQKTD